MPLINFTKTQLKSFYRRWYREGQRARTRDIQAGKTQSLREFPMLPRAQGGAYTPFRDGFLQRRGRLAAS